MDKITQSLPRDKKWHNLPIYDISQLLNVNIKNGLDIDTVKLRQNNWGLNKMTPKKPMHPLIRFLIHLRQPLILILLIAGLVTVLLEEWVDAGVIFGVVLVNSIVEYLQESKATKAIESLSKMITTESTVIRSGSKKRISSIDLVMGDIVLLRSGDRVPADLRLFDTKDLRIDESILTGESITVEKNRVEPIDRDAILAERKNMVYSGTLVTYGHGIGIVVAIGDMTEVGNISKSIGTTQETATPLIRKLDRFSKVILYVIMALAIITFVVGIVRNQHTFEITFMSAIALAVAAIPEGLPAALTITLAIGVNRMAKRHAIIRKLPAVETLGSTTVICSDKTGTLTQNQMTVTRIYSGDVKYAVTGNGYKPDGEIRKEKDEITRDKLNKSQLGSVNLPNYFKECLASGMLCNDSSLVQKNPSQWEAKGDPTETALIVSSLKAGLSEKEINKIFPRLDTIPFESQLRYMATLHMRSEDIIKSNNLIYVKGDVEKILSICSFVPKTHLKSNNNVDNRSTALTSILDYDIQQMTPRDLENIRKVFEELASDGLRVLAFARKSVCPEKSKIDTTDIDADFIFLGLQAMIDPPRSEVITAIRNCRNAGIEVKMVTGDNIHTSKRIAKQIGLERILENDMVPDCHNFPNETMNNVAAITGKELEKCSPNELNDIIKKTKVFARTTPEQKLLIVKTLQKMEHVVAVTGDGVNDAPALKQADIGIAMGITGSDVAKEAADMVLTDDNFASIESAVEVGRGIFDNIMKFITWTLPTNFGEASVILVSMLLGISLPILPVQILWINMTTALALGMMLIFEPEEPNVMRRPPQRPTDPLLKRDNMVGISIVTTIILVAALGMFTLDQQSANSTLDESRTVVVNTIVMIEMMYLLNCRSLAKSMFHIGVFSNRFIILGVIIMISLQVAYTYIPTMNSLFKSAPIDMESWIWIMGISLTSYLIIETEKWLRYNGPSILKRFKIQIK